MEGGERFCFTDPAKIYFNIVTEFEKQQEMEKTVQKNLVFNEIFSILNNMRNLGLTYKHVASSQISTYHPTPFLSRMYLAQRRLIPLMRLYNPGPVFC